MRDRLYIKGGFYARLVNGVKAPLYGIINKKGDLSRHAIQFRLCMRCACYNFFCGFLFTLLMNVVKASLITLIRRRSYCIMFVIRCLYLMYYLISTGKLEYLEVTDCDI